MEKNLVIKQYIIFLNKTIKKYEKQIKIVCYSKANIKRRLWKNDKN